MTDTTNDFNLLLKLPFGITAVKAGFQAKLIQQTFVEPSGCQLWIWQIQYDILFFRKFFVKPSDQSGFSTSGFCCYYGKELSVRSVTEPAKSFSHGLASNSWSAGTFLVKGVCFISKNCSYMACLLLPQWCIGNGISQSFFRFLMFLFQRIQKTRCFRLYWKHTCWYYLFLIAIRTYLQRSGGKWHNAGIPYCQRIWRYWIIRNLYGMSNQSWGCFILPSMKTDTSAFVNFSVCVMQKASATTDASRKVSGLVSRLNSCKGVMPSGGISTPMLA